MRWFLIAVLSLLPFQFSLYTSSLVPLCNHDDASALLSFKNSFSLEEHYFADGMCESYSSKTESWKNDTDCCLWEGVSCDTKSGHVIGLDLGCSGLQGQFNPNTTLLQLTHLQSLNLGYSDFYNSPIPSGLFLSLPNLTFLDLSFANFSSDIPNVIAKHSRLEHLYLTGNNLVGQLPSSLFGLTHLSVLDCSHNKLVGSIPDTTSELSNLTYLYLSGNSLNGTIPQWCFSLSSLLRLFLNRNQIIGSIGEFSAFSLEECDFSYNKLQGNIPKSLFDLRNLSLLALSSNNLSGIVDFHQFSNLQHLSTFDLSYNHFLYLSSNAGGHYTFPNLEYLNLSSCNINTFPNFLNGLKNLRSLDLSRNQMHGRIPKWFNNTGKDTLSFLDLSHNLLTSVGYLSLSSTNLGYIDLSFNILEGNIPIIPFSTVFFSVSNNKFTGHISSAICNASSLQILELSHNNLTGKLPPCFGIFPSLSVLDLQSNNLSGIIPKSYLDIEALETMNLNGNQLEGPLPQSMVKCKYLGVLDLGQNNIQDTFPTWLESLEHLEVLVLRANRFNGTINCLESNNSFPMLRVFDISNNNFSGNLPTACIKNFKGMMANVNNGLQYMNAEKYSSRYYDCIVVTIKGEVLELERILTIFTAIDLSNNRFKGEIPVIIGELKSLKGLNFSHNKISGFIPQTMGDLENLEWLDISSNRFMGEIPYSLTNLHFLSVLNLSQNQLEGKIPTGKQFDTFENDSYKDNPGLCGLPLLQSCHKDEKQHTHSTTLDQFQQNEQFGFGWKPVAIGYASGSIFGIVLGYVVFFIRKPEWSIRFVEGILNQRLRKMSNRSNATRSSM